MLIVGLVLKYSPQAFFRACGEYLSTKPTMSIVHWFRNDLSSKDRVLTRDLISMAIADGEFTEEERLEILRICRSQGISEQELIDSMRGKDICMPQTKEEKYNYISPLISVMNADSVCSPLEVRTLKVLANRIGFNIEEMLP